MRSKHIHVTIDLDRVRASALAIRTRTGTALIAVVKADAYGLGARRVADALDDVADEFAYFSIDEAREIGRPGVVLGPLEAEPSAYSELRLRPALSNLRDAQRFSDTPFVLSVDSGMQRFGCNEVELGEILRHCRVAEAYTHAADARAVARFKSLCAGRIPRLHAAATSLIDDPATWLDAVRPGYALYRGAVRVHTHLHAIRHTSGPIGYSGFQHPQVGILLAGYSNGLAPVSVRVNGRPQRLIEAGMNSSFISIDPRDRPGDEVVLCGEGLDEAALGTELRCRPHEILCRYCAMGVREYFGGRRSNSTSGVQTPELATSR
ncbi:MAG: alanine racemase [Phycisphaerae bacterium]